MTFATAPSPPGESIVDAARLHHRAQLHAALVTSAAASKDCDLGADRQPFATRSNADATVNPDNGERRAQVREAVDRAPHYPA
ncbi:MAG TPA: hypothetical protein VMO88_04085 [Acidimicrobiales bacterium]|nr:hypothetical protein [Acidimicrobiales bacterium]